MAIELIIAVPLTLRFAMAYDEPPGRAVYLGVFHAVSSFNNAGFALFTDNMIPFATDPWICVPIVIAVVLGGIGFPVLFELGRRIRVPTGRWTLHTRVTVITYAILVVVGVGAFLIAEWNNDGTIGGFDLGGKLVVGLFHGVMPRTAGFNSVDVGVMHPATLLITDMLMFIGGGSAGTAGGIKVTTFALLAFVIWAEVRGEPTVHVGNRRLAGAVQRQALTVALLGVGLVAVSTVTLLSITEFRLDDVLFEAVSAFATVGLSTGHHRRPAPIRTARADGADVPGQTGPDHPGLRARPARTGTPLRTAREADHRWPGKIVHPPAAASSSSAWAASAPPWPASWCAATQKCWASTATLSLCSVTPTNSPTPPSPTPPTPRRCASSTSPTSSAPWSGAGATWRPAS